MFSASLAAKSYDPVAAEAFSRKWALTGFKESLSQALASGDPARWGAMLGDLMNEFRYKREDAIEILLPLLIHHDWDVRVTAATQLLDLGSYEGVRVLQAALSAFANGEKIEERIAAAAVGALHRHRQIIDPDALWGSSQRSKPQNWNEIMTMQQVPQMRDVVLQLREENQAQSRYDSEWIAAYLGMKDSNSIAKYEGLLKLNDPRSRLLGHWALYQARETPEDLEYVISVCRQAVGLERRDKQNQYSNDIAPLAFDFLRVTITPRAKSALEEIADFVANTPGGNSVYFQPCFSSLFYFFKDYAFVDKFVLSFLSGQYRGSGVDRGLVMRIAAVRRTPEIEAAAKVFSAAVYEQDFILLKGRPAESWAVDLQHVPITIAPPLPALSPQ